MGRIRMMRTTMPGDIITVMILRIYPRSDFQIKVIKDLIRGAKILGDNF